MLPDRLRRIVQLLARLPGVGEKTARRFALMFVQDPDFARDLAGGSADSDSPRPLVSGWDIVALRRCTACAVFARPRLHCRKLLLSCQRV